MFLRFRSALPLALARTFSLWFGASCSLPSGLFFLRCHQKVDGNDRQSEGVVRITSNTLSPKGKEDFTESVLNTEAIRKQRFTFAERKGYVFRRQVNISKSSDYTSRFMVNSISAADHDCK